MPNEAAMTIDESARARAFAQARRERPEQPPRPPDPTFDSLEAASQDVFRRRLNELVRQRKAKAVFDELKSGIGASMIGSTTIAQKGSKWLSYTVWAAAIDNIPVTFGLSLLILIYHDWHYMFKFFRIAPFHEFLCEPGADGMLGILPPSRVPLGIIQFLYKTVNYIGLFCFNLLLLLIATIIFIQFFLPLIIMVAVLQNISELNIGALWDYFIALL